MLERDPARTGPDVLLNKQYEDARRELVVYIERRAYDPEGLYYYGQTLEGLGRPAEALKCTRAPWKRPGPRRASEGDTRPSGAGWRKSN